MKQTISELTLAPSSGGRFEISVNGGLVYSKLATGEFPDPDAVFKSIRAKS